MSNFKIFNNPLNPLNSGMYGLNPNGIWQPIHINSKNALNTTDQVEYNSRLGNYYVCTTGSQSVGNSQFLVLQLTNPAASTKSIHLERISGGGLVNSTLDIFRSATFSAAGTVSTPRNGNYGFGDNSVASVKWIVTSPDPTTGGQLTNTNIQSSGMATIDYGGRIIIPPNKTILLRITNNANQANQLALRVAWWEETV